MHYIVQCSMLKKYLKNKTADINNMIKQNYIDEILIALKKTNSDANIDDRLIERWMDTQRAIFIKNKINQGETIEDNITQTIHNIKVDIVDASMNNAVPTRGRFLRTSARLPKFIECTNRLLLTSVRLPELNGREVNTVKREEINYTGSGVLNTDEMFGFLYNGYYYLKIPDTNFKISLITIRLFNV